MCGAAPPRPCPVSQPGHRTSCPTDPAPVRRPGGETIAKPVRTYVSRATIYRALQITGPIGAAPASPESVFGIGQMLRYTAEALFRR